MQPRSEPLLWLQCLALGAIPLELLVIRLVLAGADPGPVPGVERFLIWGVGVLAPTVALWRRPADWGSLLLVRQPLASRSSDQLRISASQSGLSSRIAVVVAAVILLPTLWWLDDSAVLVNEFSPVSGQSRLVTLLLVSPLLALIVWQLQQLVQAAAILVGSAATIAAADSTFRADAVTTQRTSLGLQLLHLPALDWPDPAPEITTEPAAGQNTEETIEKSVESEAEATDQAAETPDEDASDDDASAGDDDAQHEDEFDQPNNNDPVEPIDSSPSEPQTDNSTENENTEQESTDTNPTMSAESDEFEAEELKLDNEDTDDSSNSALDVDSTADEAAVDEAVVDEAVVDEAAVDEAAVDEAAVDEAAVDEAAVDEAAVDEAAVDEAAVDEAAVDEAAVDEAAVDEAAVDEAAVDEAAVDEAAVDEAAVDEAAVDEAAVDEAAVDEAAVDEAAVDEAAVDEAAVDDVEDEADSAKNANPSASPESVTAAATPVPVEPEQPGEEEEGTTLDPEISQVDTFPSGSTEGHREQAEPSGGKESEPEQSSETPPGSL